MKYVGLRLALVAAFTLIILPGAAAQPSGPPRVSPTATVSQVIGVSQVDLTYARPQVKDRKIWGEVVPLGEVWRTGANEATRITLSTDAKVEGKPLAAGTYALFTIPGEHAWTVIFNKEAEQWGAFQYKEAQDALRVEVKPRSADHQEAFSITFDDVTTQAATLTLRWEKVAVPIRLRVDTASLAFARAEKETEGNPQAAFGWARYLFEEGAHLDRALAWATAAAGAQESYWTLSLKARLEQKTGTGSAVATARKALELAASSNNSFAKQNAEQLEKEIEGWGD